MFLLKNDRENGIVIYATRGALELLASCQTIIADGTFKSCPKPFKQLYVLMGVKDRKSPLVFGFLPAKSTPIYRRFLAVVMRKMRHLNLVINIRQIVTDYEWGMIN